MPSFVTVTSGATAQAQDVNQLINAMNGTPGQGVPISLTAVNDSVNFALAVKNADPTNSRSLQVLRSNNNVLLQADVNGVIVSPDGGATTAQVVNTTLAQTLTNKTLGATNSIATAALAANAITQTAQSLISTGSTASAVLVDTGLTVTLTTTGGDVLIFGQLCSANSLAASQLTMALLRDGVNFDNCAVVSSPGANYLKTTPFSVRDSAPAAGAHTYKVQYSTGAGTETISTVVNSALVAVELKK